MKAGDKIKVDMGWSGMYSDWQVFEVEEFRHCLGIFKSSDHREMGKFIPLCELYCEGPDSEDKYMPHLGEYKTNLVQSWIDCTDNVVIEGES